MISKEEITGLAELARLKLTEKEITGLQKDISSILEYVGQVSAVSQGDTLTSGLSKVSPLVRNVMRDDTPRTESDLLSGKEEPLRAAFPKREGDYNVVRKIIQKDE
ncbi:MAG: Asp-tRNA(Asn)/Glu-tRNA(Gln) amidotransferase subunit GatC [Candidatus Adlerbacteria bacterium]|nr:Asp-tRNA(Asn)/Glu-tRNA(Gln) amidotransferase subunit GatC [Candidatus Adlerbacteria bacterium]